VTLREGDFSSPEEAGAEEAASAAFLERREPLGLFPSSNWLTAGEPGRDVSGVGIGVASVEAEIVSVTCLGAGFLRAGTGGGGRSWSSPAELEGGVRSVGESGSMSASSGLGAEACVLSSF